MRRLGRPAGILGAGAALLALAWSVGPHSAPPLYDSGPIVAENYRYLHTPPGFKATPPPGSIDVTLTLLAGQSPPMAETTDEQPAQAQLLAAQGAFAVPPKTKAVHVVIKAIDPPAPPPPDAVADGNVYEFSVTAVASPPPPPPRPGQKVPPAKPPLRPGPQVTPTQPPLPPGPQVTPAQLPFRPGQQVTVVLRGPAGVANPTLELWNGAAWSKLDTQPLGNTAPDSYAANVSQLGDITLFAPPTAPSSGGGGNAGLVVAVVVIAVVVAAAGVVLVLRRT